MLPRKHENWKTRKRDSHGYFSCFRPFVLSWLVFLWQLTFHSHKREEKTFSGDNEIVQTKTCGRKRGSGRASCWLLRSGSFCSSFSPSISGLCSPLAPLFSRPSLLCWDAPSFRAENSPPRMYSSELSWLLFYTAFSTWETFFSCLYLGSFLLSCLTVQGTSLLFTPTSEGSPPPLLVFCSFSP